MKFDKGLPEINLSVSLLGQNINENVAKIKEKLGDAPDLIIRVIKQGGNQSALAVIHIDGITNTQEINEHIVEPLLSCKSKMEASSLKDELEQTITISNISMKNSMDDLLSEIVSGKTIILIEGEIDALTLDTKRVESRSITEPSTQTVIRGPKDCFNENLRTTPLSSEEGF